MYFNDDNKHVESLHLNQDEHHSKIIEKINDTKKSFTINQNSEQTYDQHVTEYIILQKYKYMLHNVLFK